MKKKKQLFITYRNIYRERKTPVYITSISITTTPLLEINLCRCRRTGVDLCNHCYILLRTSSSSNSFPVFSDVHLFSICERNVLVSAEYGRFLSKLQTLQSNEWTILSKIENNEINKWEKKVMHGITYLLVN